MKPVKTDSILDAIVARKMVDLDAEISRAPLAVVRHAAERAAPSRDFAGALRRAPIGIVAEIKRQSPSKGILADVVDPASLALQYQAAGADAISVLTEEHHFKGSLDDLQAVRMAVDIPVLRKDFLFAPYHLYQARAAGADAALLIVAMLDDVALRDLITLGQEIGLATLVEVHAEAEVARALRAGASIVGINNRNLHTFAVDLAVTERLRPLIPPDLMVIGESGVHVAADVTRLRSAGVQAILVGESLMRAGPAGVAAKLAEFRGAP